MRHLCSTSLLLLATCAAGQGRPATAASTANTQPARPVANSIDPAKKAEILRFMQLTGGEEISVQLTKQTQASVRPVLEESLPPGEYRAKLIDLFLAKFGPRFTEEIVMPTIESVYDKHFSVDELTQLIAFFESPLGKKAASVLPDIDAQIPTMQEAVGKLGEKCMAEVLEENPDLQRAMERAEKSKAVPATPAPSH